MSGGGVGWPTRFCRACWSVLFSIVILRCSTQPGARVHAGRDPTAVARPSASLLQSVNARYCSFPPRVPFFPYPIARIYDRAAPPCHAAYQLFTKCLQAGAMSGGTPGRLAALDARSPSASGRFSGSRSQVRPCARPALTVIRGSPRRGCMRYYSTGLSDDAGRMAPRCLLAQHQALSYCDRAVYPGRQKRWAGHLAAANGGGEGIYLIALPEYPSASDALPCIATGLSTLFKHVCRADLR